MALAGCITFERAAPVEVPMTQAELQAILDEHGAYAVGAGVLRDGELVWSGHAGEQAPGVPAGRRSMFNTASVSKAVTAETVLSLVATGEIGLDEPLHRHWVDPDVEGDPRHRLLTPRLVLTHRTGFPNWRYQASDGRLAFEADPGAAFGYSGEGFQYLKRFVEAKLGRPFEDLVQERVFDVHGMGDSAVVERDGLEGRLVLPRAEDGAALPPNVNPPGDANAADDLFTTVEDYAKLLRSLCEAPRTPLDVEKTTLQTSVADHPNWTCEASASTRCPRAHGFGLGWLVFEWEDVQLVWHGGNDSDEHAIGYVDPATGDGALVLTNGASGIFVLLDVLDLIDERPAIVDFYRSLLGATSE